jgi:tripartite-type tricarboxylate transporter receptor subunit TctC
MRFSRRIFLGRAAATAGLPLMPDLASAEVYPSRPVHMIVEFPAGLAPDVLARLISESLSHQLGQNFVVENKPGAGGNVGAEYVIRAAPDGYTLLVMVSGNAASAALYPNLDFNFVRDIAPIAFLGYTPFVVVVNPSVTVKTISELIAYAKTNPGKLNYASQGAGTAPHLAFELFRMMTGVNIVHVPYRTSYLPDLLAGPSTARLCHGPAGARVPPYREAQRARRDEYKAHGGVAGCARDNRIPARLRGKRLGRRWSADRHVGRNHRCAQ